MQLPKGFRQITDPGPKAFGSCRRTSAAAEGVSPPSILSHRSTRRPPSRPGETNKWICLGYEDDCARSPHDRSCAGLFDLYDDIRLSFCDRVRVRERQRVKIIGVLPHTFGHQEALGEKSSNVVCALFFGSRVVLLASLNQETLLAMAAAKSICSTPLCVRMRLILIKSASLTCPRSTTLSMYGNVAVRSSNTPPCGVCLAPEPPR